MEETEYNGFTREIQWDIKISSFKQRTDSGITKGKNVCGRKRALDRATEKYPAFHTAEYD